MKKLTAILALVVLALPVHSRVQRFDPIGGGEVAAKAKALGLSDLKIANNKWASVISNNEVGMMLSALYGKHGLGIGADTVAILKAIQEALLLTQPENREWLKPSLLMEKGRINVPDFAHEVSTGGPETTSKTTSYRVGSTSVEMESGTSIKSLSIKVTYLPTMESKVFTWSVTYSSDNMVDLSYARAFLDAFRRSGLPSFNVTTWEQSDPRIRRGLVAVGKLWEKIDKEGISEIVAWMEQVSAK